MQPEPGARPVPSGSAVSIPSSASPAVCWASTNSAEALLVYDQLVQQLRDELGVPPSAETRVLHTSILRTPP